MVESCGALPANLGGWRQLRVWATGGRYRRDPRRLPVAEEWPRPAFIRKTQKNQSIVERERERLIRCEKGKRNDIVSLLSPEEMMGPAIIIHWKKREERGPTRLRTSPMQIGCPYPVVEEDSRVQLQHGIKEELPTIAAPNGTSSRLSFLPRRKWSSSINNRLDCGASLRPDSNSFSELGKYKGSAEFWTWHNRRSRRKEELVFHLLERVNNVVAPPLRSTGQQQRRKILSLLSSIHHAKSLRIEDLCVCRCIYLENGGSAIGLWCGLNASRSFGLICLFKSHLVECYLLRFFSLSFWGCVMDAHAVMRLWLFSHWGGGKSNFHILHSKSFFLFFLFTIFIYNIVAVVNKRWETLRVFGCLVSLRLLFSSLVDAQRERNLPFVVKEGRLKHKRIITGRRGNVLFFSPGRKEVNCHRKGHRVGIAPRDMIYPDSFLYNILKLSLGWLRSVTGWLLAFFFLFFLPPVPFLIT